MRGAQLFVVACRDWDDDREPDVILRLAMVNRQVQELTLSRARAPVAALVSDWLTSPTCSSGAGTPAVADSPFVVPAMPVSPTTAPPVRRFPAGLSRRGVHFERSCSGGRVAVARPRQRSVARRQIPVERQPLGAHDEVIHRVEERHGQPHHDQPATYGLVGIAAHTCPFAPTSSATLLRVSAKPATRWSRQT